MRQKISVLLQIVNNCTISITVTLMYLSFQNRLAMICKIHNYKHVNMRQKITIPLEADSTCTLTHISSGKQCLTKEGH